MTLFDHRSATFSLSALTGAVASFVAAMPGAPGDDRIAAVPDERTLRYYQSLGLLDRPLRYDGRAAVYGYRHLLQALAVRALQLRGASLAQAQGALAGASDATLEAAVVEALGARPGGVPPDGGALPVAPVAGPPRPSPGAGGEGWHAVEVAPGVLVCVDVSRHPDPAALVAAIRAALPPSPTPPRGNRP